MLKELHSHSIVGFEKFAKVAEEITRHGGSFKRRATFDRSTLTANIEQKKSRSLVPQNNHLSPDERKETESILKDPSRDDLTSSSDELVRAPQPQKLAVVPMKDDI